MENLSKIIIFANYRPIFSYQKEITGNLVQATRKSALAWRRLNDLSLLCTVNPNPTGGRGDILRFVLILPRLPKSGYGWIHQGNTNSIEIMASLG